MLSWSHQWVLSVQLEWCRHSWAQTKNPRYHLRVDNCMSIANWLPITAHNPSCFSAFLSPLFQNTVYLHLLTERQSWNYQEKEYFTNECVKTVFMDVWCNIIILRICQSSSITLWQHRPARCDNCCLNWCPMNKNILKNIAKI